MTPSQSELIRTTFAQIQPIADTAAGLFYARLFEIAPEVKPLFRGDIGAQGLKLMQTIGVAVAHVDRLDAVAPAVQALARRHADYGVTAQHYDTVGSALLWTLEQGLGDAFTPEVSAAWATLYTTLATTMIAAAYPAGITN